MGRLSFDALPEYEVARIVAKHMQKGRNRCKIPIYHLQYTNYRPESDTWETRQNLKNTPEVLCKWGKFKELQKKKLRTMEYLTAKKKLFKHYAFVTNFIPSTIN